MLHEAKPDLIIAVAYPTSHIRLQQLPFSLKYVRSLLIHARNLKLLCGVGVRILLYVLQYGEQRLGHILCYVFKPIDKRFLQVRWNLSSVSIEACLNEILYLWKTIHV